MSYMGTYDRTIFYNPVNKYCVISVKTNDQSIPQQARSAYRHRDRLIRFVATGYELPQTDKVSAPLSSKVPVLLTRSSLISHPDEMNGTASSAVLVVGASEKFLVALRRFGGAETLYLFCLAVIIRRCADLLFKYSLKIGLARKAKMIADLRQSFVRIAQKTFGFSDLAFGNKIGDAFAGLFAEFFGQI